MKKMAFHCKNSSVDLEFCFSQKLFQIFYTIWKKKSTKVDFSPYRGKKHHSTLEMDTFKGMLLLLSYLASLDKKPRTCPLKFCIHHIAA